MTSVNLLRDPADEYIKGLRSVPSDELLFDHALVHTWWNNIDKAPERYRDKKTLRRLHGAIVKEMLRRGMRHDSPLVKRTLPVKSFRRKKLGKPVSVEEVLQHFQKPVIIYRDFISLVGGIVENGATEGDIDVLIKLPPDTPPRIVRPFEFRLGRALPAELSSRLQVMFNDFDGPITSYVPLYHLALIPAEQVRVELSGISDEQARREAKKSAEEDKIKPLRFFYPLKASRGYHEGEVYNVKQIFDWFKGKATELSIEKKYDGLRIIWMKKGDKVIARTDGGKDATSRFPTLVKMLKQLPVEELVIDSEVEGWRGKEHMGREEISAYVNSKSEPDDSMVVANVFDILYIDGLPKHHEIDAHGDLHLLPYRERRRILRYLATLAGWTQTETYPKTPGFNVVPMHIVEMDDPEELERVLQKVRDLPGSEGAMIKSLDSPYPLTGLTGGWLKYKKSADVHAIVIERHPTKSGTTFTYTVGLLIPSGWNVPEDRIAEIKFKDGKKRKVMIVGRTYATKVKASPGDIVTVLPHTIFHYERDGKQWIHLYEPNFYELRPDQVIPDDAEDAVKIAKQAGILQVKQSFISPEWMTDEPAEFIFQHHFRGRTMHTDFRIKHPKYEDLLGFTLNDLIDECIKEPVKTMRDARSYDHACSKMTNRPPEDEREKILVEQKYPEPDEWFELEGVVPPGEVGATKNYPGVFTIYERGKLYFGAVKPYFVELFLYGKKFKGRYVIRKLPNPWGRKPQFVYLFWKTDDQTPYVLSKRAVQKGWVPPKGVSALPPEIRKQIPEQYRYWKFESESERRRVRDLLVNAIHNGEVKIKLGAAKKRDKFTLQYQYWRGQIVIRKGPSDERWILWLPWGPYFLDANPLENLMANAVPADIPPEARKMDGEVKPGTLLNPTKATPSRILKLAEGDVEVFIDDPLVRKFRLRWRDGASEHDACYVMEPEDPDELDGLWIIYRVRCAP